MKLIDITSEIAATKAIAGTSRELTKAPTMKMEIWMVVKRKGLLVSSSA